MNIEQFLMICDYWRRGLLYEDFKEPYDFLTSKYEMFKTKHYGFEEASIKARIELYNIWF